MNDALFSAILIDIPVPILTPRLLLRPAKSGDGKQLNEAILESMNELKAWMPWAQHAPTLSESEEIVRKSSARWILREDLHLMICDRATGRVLGGTGLHRMNWAVPKFEIGYWIRSSEHNKGLATESALALTHFAFDQLKAKRIEIKCDPKNTKSINVPQKLGYALEGCIKNDGVEVDGVTPRDTLVFIRLNRDQLAATPATW